MSAPQIQDPFSFQTPLADCVFSADVLHVRTRDTARDTRSVEEHYEIIRSKLRRSYKWLLEITICREFEKSSTRIVESSLPRWCNALAIVTTHACSKMVASYFIVIAQKAGLPEQEFFKEKDAESWLASQK